MDKRDFRVQYPLWNIVLFVIFMVWSYSLVYCSDLLLYYYGNLFGVEGLEWPERIYPLAVGSFIAGPILLVGYFILYIKQIKKHNQKYPHQKMNVLTLFRPVEFIDEDELFSHVTRNAARKVYIYYANMLPIFVALLWFPFDRYVFIVALLLILILQNLLYYREICKYIDGDGDAPKGEKWEQKITKQVLLVFAGVAVVTVIAATAILLIKGEEQQQEAMEQMEACLENNQTAVIEGGWFKPTKVTCE